jgi:hypothetical protein
MMKLFTRTFVCALALCVMTSCASKGKKAATPEPIPMKGAAVLFDGKSTSKWVQRDGSPCAWVVKDGAMTAVKGDIVSKQKFRDQDLHLEYWLPKSPKPESLKRGDHTNSGVYLQGRYEIQILDSYGLAPLMYQDCGAIYHQKAPDVNACLPAERWQTMDIHFIAAKYDGSGKKTSNARITVFQNGTKVQDDQEILGTTAGGDAEWSAPGPVRLQYHSGAVKFRNVRVKAL